MSKGIKETREAVLALVGIGDSVNKALDDGKFSLADAAKFIDDIPAVVEAIRGSGDIVSELNDLSDDEFETLISDISDAIGDVSGAKGEAIAESSIRIAYEVNNLLKALKG